MASLVGGTGAHRIVLLDQLYPAVDVGGASELERVVPGRAALASGLCVCIGRAGNPGGFATSGELADQFGAQRVLFRGFDVCSQPGSGSHASRLADLHLRLIAHPGLFHRADAIDHAGGLAVDALVVWEGVRVYRNQVAGIGKQ